MSADTRCCVECGGGLPHGLPPGFCPNCAVQGTPDVGTAEVSSSEFGVSSFPRPFGDYELLEEIARGGMGIVYKARQVSLDRIVAVKLLLLGEHASEELIHRFRIEASAVASLQHPNIVAIHEVGVHQGHHYFAMDFVEGPNLAQLLRDQPFSPKRAAGYVKIIAEAIHFSHTRHILHRDLKPSNVLIDSSDQPRVTDFGLAKRLTNSQLLTPDTSQLTATGQVLGSPGFMPPEQASGKFGKVGVGSDVYSLGAILYHVLTGRPPFVGGTAADTLQQVLNQEPISPRVLLPSLPADLETICLKCLEKEPAKRFPSAQALADELGRFLRDELIHARPISRSVRVRRWVRRNRLATGLLTALGAGLATAIGFYLHAAHEVKSRKAAEAALNTQIAQVLGDMSLSRKYVEVHSEALASFRGRRVSILDGPHERFTLGVSVYQNHVATVLQFADLASYLENTIGEELKGPVRINLRLYDEMPLNAARLDGTDFLRISPWFYTEARRAGEELHPVVSHKDSTFRAAIVAHAGSGLTNLSGLPGHSLAFGERRSVVTLSGKALLVQNGILAKALSACGYIEPQHVGEFIQGGYLSTSSDPLISVVNSRYDAAIVTERQLEQSQHQNKLVVLTNFTCMDNFWVATTNISPRKVTAFQRAMMRLEDSTVLMGLPDSPTQPRGFIETSPSDLNALELTRALAECFDAIDPDGTHRSGAVLRGQSTQSLEVLHEQ